LENIVRGADDENFYIKGYKLPGCVEDKNHMFDFIHKGLPDDDNIAIFGLGDLQLQKAKEERAIVLMNRVFSHNFLVKLPHSQLLS